MELSSVTLFKFIKITFLIQTEIISILEIENVNTFKSKITKHVLRYSSQIGGST